jgi:hypothetical protein
MNIELTGSQIIEGTIKIYDFSGTLIFSFNSDDIVFTGNKALVSWNLCDFYGKSVPNGTYFVKADLIKPGASEKIYKKTAVVR